MYNYCFREAGAGGSNPLTPTNDINHLTRVSESEIQFSTPCKSTVSPNDNLDLSPPRLHAEVAELRQNAQDFASNYAR